MNIETKISEWKALCEKADGVEKELIALNSKAKTLLAEIVTKKFDCAPGQIIVTNKGRFKVTSIDHRHLHEVRKPWLMGLRQLKDGSWGTMPVRVYDDWQILKPIL